MGGAGTAVARGEEAGAAADMDAAAVDRRHPVPGAYRHPLAGPARRVRSVGAGVRPVPPLAAGRHLAADLHCAADPSRCQPPDHLGHQRGLHGVPGAPARRWGAEKWELQKGADRRRPGGAGRPRARPLARRADHQAAPGCRAGAKAHVPRGHGRDAGSPQFEAVLSRIRVPRPGTGRPRTRPRKVRADKAYSSQKNRA